MTDSNNHRGKAASDGPGPTSWASDTSAPSEVSGLTGASAFCLVVGIVNRRTMVPRRRVYGFA